MMPTVHDAAAYLLAGYGRSMSTSKLQRMVYLADGWSCALAGRPLFPELFTVRGRSVTSLDLAAHHGDAWSVDSHPAGDAGALDFRAQVIVDAVLRQYGALSGPRLTDLVTEKRLPGWEADRVAGSTVTKEAMTAAFTAMLLGSAEATGAHRASGSDISPA